MTPAIRKTTASTGNAYRSNAWTRLCPKNATTTWTATMMSRHTVVLHLVSELSANVPLTELTANQPMPPVIDMIPAGRMLPRKPNGARLSTICGTPYCGPRADRTPCPSAPRPLPMTIAATACHTLSPKMTASTPMNTVANSRLGDVHVHSSWIGLPCRSFSGISSIPPGSTAPRRSP